MFLGSEYTHLTLQGMRLAFFMSRMIVADEVKARHKFTTLSFIEFLECLARIADSTNVPTDADLAAAGAATIVDLDLALSQKEGGTSTSALKKRRPSCDYFEPKTRPLEEKLDRFIRQMIGRLGLREGGIISDGGKRISLIPKYVTREQLTSMGAISQALQDIKMGRHEKNKQ